MNFMWKPGEGKSHWTLLQSKRKFKDTAYINTGILEMCLIRSETFGLVVFSHLLQ